MPKKKSDTSLAAQTAAEFEQFDETAAAVAADMVVASTIETAPEEVKKGKGKKAAAAEIVPSGSKLARFRHFVDKALPDASGDIAQIDSDSLVAILPHIPSGSLILDSLIGGRINTFGLVPCPGIPRGRITTLSGAPSAGKTTLALQVSASVNALGGCVLYVDFENEVVPLYAKTLGVEIDNPDKFVLVQPATMEDGLRMIVSAAVAGVDLIVIDSVGAGVLDSQMKVDVRDIGNSSPIGEKARFWSQQLPILKKRIKDSHTAIIGIQQQRQAIQSMGYGDNSSEQGGTAWKYYASVRMTLSKVKTLYSDEKDFFTNKSTNTVVGAMTQVKLIKNKMSNTQGHTATMCLRYGFGFDDITDMLEVAINHNKIKRQGSWILWEDPLFPGGVIKQQGMESFRKAILQYPQVPALLRNLLHQITVEKSTESKTKRPMSLRSYESVGYNEETGEVDD